MPFPWGFASRTSDGRGELPYSAAGCWDGDLLVCETFHALPSGNGEKCNKPLVILVTHHPRSASAAQLERSCSQLQRVGYWDDLHLTPALQHRDYWIDGFPGVCCFDCNAIFFGWKAPRKNSSGTNIPPKKNIQRRIPWDLEVALQMGFSVKH